MKKIYWVADETDEDFGPFKSFEEAFESMLEYLNMTEEEYNSNFTAQELVYVFRKELMEWLA